MTLCTLLTLLVVSCSAEDLFGSTLSTEETKEREEREECEEREELEEWEEWEVEDGDGEGESHSGVDSTAV